MSYSPYYRDPVIQNEVEQIRRRLAELETQGWSQSAYVCRLGGLCEYPKSWMGTQPPCCQKCGMPGASSAPQIITKGGIE